MTACLAHLEQGVDDGADVRQLEEKRAGYGAGLDVDETFTTTPWPKSRPWETDLGCMPPTASSTIGDVVFVTAPGDVLGDEASVGDTLEAGSPVLTIGAERDATEAAWDSARPSPSNGPTGQPARAP